MIPAVSAATGSGSLPPLSYLWVAVGLNGGLYTSTSTTASSWTSRTSSFSTTNINGVASDGTSLYVAVGDTQKLATSADGITWTQRTSSFTTANIKSVAYGNGYWVAVGDNSQVAYSTNGTTWTQKTTGITGNVNRVAWGNGLWIIGNTAGSLYTATDPTGTWTSRTSTLAAITGLVYFKGQSIWIAGSDTGTTGALASSTDGATWTARTSAFNLSSANAIAWANSSTAIVLGQTSSLVLDVQSSTNGTTWTDRTLATSGGVQTFSQPASDGSDLIVLEAGGVIQTSTNGSSWTDRGAISAGWNAFAITHSSGTPSMR